MVLDDGHLIADARKPNYKAIKWLRPLAKACLILTATPLYDDWKDTYAYASLLKAHWFENFDQHEGYFADRGTDEDIADKDKLVPWLKAFILIRKISTASLQNC